ncbi:ATP-dependent DNA helicase PIF1-like [Rhipicephalus sanguineus]|uniref:ATP-dependent DNA helicase PIF1-like n=1 Tax=Rhipicephalus sanguineus TaxID=34632 RepID=UPI001894C15E|nr:ATP-dependent DNA helicase PIF1-like [Rhipicephalus sanguineus]XP_037521309.1 ATP-dependent DNA helicase PIF1-like [Rhipicephalus sanguineus]
MCTHNAYVSCATTGKAAVATGGLTVRAAFKLSMRTDGGLRDGDLNSFRSTFTNIKCVIVVECSMMSSDTLARVDDRLWQITVSYNEPFGGLDLIMCGDSRQLPPVRANEVYKRSRTRDNIFNMHVTWHHLSHFPLTQVVRQSDANCSTALSKVGDGRVLEKEEVDMLQARFFSKDDAKLHCPHGVRLFHCNKEDEAYNTQDAAQGVDAIYEANADETIVGYCSDADSKSAKRRLRHLTISEVDNLPRRFVLCSGKPYMLTLNIDVSNGLGNGAVGQLKHGQLDELGLPKRLWLHFPSKAPGNIARVKSKTIREVAGPVVPVDSVPIELRTATITLDKKRMFLAVASTSL